MWADEKWVLVPFDFQKLKDILFSWQTGMTEQNAWNAVFWCNHDQPRVVSRFGDEGEYWKQSAKMLGTVIRSIACAARLTSIRARNWA